MRTREEAIEFIAKQMIVNRGEFGFKVEDWKNFSAMAKMAAFTFGCSEEAILEEAECIFEIEVYGEVVSF